MRFFNGRTAMAAACVCFALSAGTAHAQSAQENGTTAVAFATADVAYASVIRDLESSGYQVVHVKRTFLGRIQITAQNAHHTREIVVSRTTGEIMRDVVLVANMQTGSGSGSDTSGSSGGGGTVQKSVESVKSTTASTTSKVKKTVKKVTGGLGLGG